VILATLEAGQIAEKDLLEVVCRCFPELEADELRSSIHHLTNLGYLSRIGSGVLQVGPEAERVWGGGHYCDLMATFTGANLLTARHGAAEIGLLDPTILAGQKTGVVSVLLAGKSWEVREIDWRRRLVWLEPGPGGGRARWMGSGRSMSSELAASIRKVLHTGEVGSAAMSRRAGEALERLRDEIPVGAENLPMQQISDDRYRVWTYAGTTVNRTLLLSGRQEGAVRCDGLSIDFSSDPRGKSIGIGEIQLSVQVYRELIKSVKFADLLSDNQAVLLAKARFIAERASLPTTE
jgi:ATP-dependent Lhr-like helicase